jgi:raffinose/stachyose/melibiose transport system substrate-binding protein
MNVKCHMIIFILLLFLCTCAEKEQEDTVLRVWDFKYRDVDIKDDLKEIDDLFMEKHPGIIIEHSGFSDLEYIPNLAAALLAGTGPDVIWVHPGMEFNQLKGYFLDISEYTADIQELFFTESLDLCRSGGNAIKGLPLTFQGFGWYYNKEAFRNAGLDPEAPLVYWDDFITACRILKDNEITPIALGNNPSNGIDFIRRILISSFFSEQEIYDFYKNGRGLFSDRFRIIIGMCEELFINDFFDKNDLFMPYFMHGQNAFLTGDYGFIPGLLSDISHWKNFTEGLGKENIGYFPNFIYNDEADIPIQLIQWAGIICSVNKDTENPDLAVSYIKHLFSNDSVRILVENAGALVPLKELDLPVEKYPVLDDIYKALEHTQIDIETVLNNVIFRDYMYRMDDIFFNTREINLNEYILKLQEFFSDY